MLVASHRGVEPEGFQKALDETNNDSGRTMLRQCRTAPRTGRLGQDLCQLVGCVVAMVGKLVDRGARGWLIVA